MDKTLIFRLFGHFHTEVNPEMIPTVSRWAAEISGSRLFWWAAESLKIEYFKFFLNRKFFIYKKYNFFNFLFLDSRQPAKTGWFISGLFFVHN
jgi:hypothetical protein